jgi:hypothetical protein
VSALSENDNKYLCSVVSKFFLLLVENPEFCLVLLHQSWGSVFAPWCPWFGEGLLCAKLHQHPHISTVIYARFRGAKIHISLVFCIELINQFPQLFLLLCRELVLQWSSCLWKVPLCCPTRQLQW